MPSLGNVARIVQNYKTLDLTASEEGNGSNAGLPTQHTEPANDVAEELLVFLGCKFGYPVILTTGSGCPLFLSAIVSHLPGRRTGVWAVGLTTKRL